MILLIDNYDSFSYNLYQLIGAVEPDIKVVRNDECTLEEIAEVISQTALKQLDAPCILYNLNGYYDGLKALLFHMIEMGLSTEERQKQIYFVENLADIKAILGE